MSIRKKMTIAAMVMLTSGSMASATTVSYSQSFGPQTTDFTTPTYQLSGFDSTLGTLTGVLVEYSFTDSMSGTITNNANTASTFRITESAKATFYFTGALNNNYLTDVSNQQTYTSQAAHTSAAYNAYTGTSAGSANIATLANFVDNPLNFSVKTVTSTTILGGGGNITASIATQGSGFARVTYSYDAPVPEPATWAMMIGGFGMIGVAARRRRAATAGMKVGLAG